MYHLQQKYSIFFKSLIENVSVRGEGRRVQGACKGEQLSSSSTSSSQLEVKGRGPLFSGQGPLIMGEGGLVNDTTPVFIIEDYQNNVSTCIPMYVF